MGRLKMAVYLDEERDIVKEIREKISGKIFIDLGAFIGEYSINLADNFEEVWAYEPATDSYKKLQVSIEKYGVKNIKTFNEAVGSEVGLKKLYRNRDHQEKSGIKFVWGGSTGFDRRNLDEYTVPLENVHVTTLKEIIGEKEIDLIKMDVEGHEGSILQGGKDVIRQVKHIIIELHNNRGDVYGFLRRNGFKQVKTWEEKRIWFKRVK